MVGGSDCDGHMDADTPISEIFAARMQPPRNGEEYIGLLKFQLHELAAVRAKDPTFSPSAASIDTLFASPGKALFDAAIYDVPAIPREIARDCLVALYDLPLGVAGHALAQLRQRRVRPAHTAHLPDESPRDRRGEQCRRRVRRGARLRDEGQAADRAGRRAALLVRGGLVPKERALLVYGFRTGCRMGCQRVKTCEPSPGGERSREADWCRGDPFLRSIIKLKLIYCSKREVKISSHFAVSRSLLHDHRACRAIPTRVPP